MVNRSHLHLAAQLADREDGDAGGLVVEAGPGAQVEDLLVQGGRDGRDVTAGAHDAPGQHERPGERVLVADRVQRPVERTEQRDLLAVHQGGDAALRLEVAAGADRGPRHRVTSSRRGTGSSGGRGWPRSATNAMLGSGVPGALTNDTNRR
jgi:hypothetical protein